MAGGSKVTTTAPWEAQQDYLTRGFERAEGLYGQGMPAYYPGQTLAGFDPEQQRAQASMLNYGRGERVGAMQSGAERALLSKLGGQTPFTDQQTSDLLAGKVDTGAGTPYGDLADVYRQQFESQAAKGLANVRQGLVNYQPGGGSRGDIYAANVVGGAQKALAQNLAQMYGGAYQQAQGQRFPMAQSMTITSVYWMRDSGGPPSLRFLSWTLTAATCIGSPIWAERASGRSGTPTAGGSSSAPTGTTRKAATSICS